MEDNEFYVFSTLSIVMKPYMYFFCTQSLIEHVYCLKPIAPPEIVLGFSSRKKRFVIRCNLIVKSIFLSIKSTNQTSESLHRRVFLNPSEP